MQKRSLLAVAIAIDGVLAAAVTNNAVGKAASKNGIHRRLPLNLREQSKPIMLEVYHA